jgi:uncharacterized protein (TIRG00374 family)
MGRWRILLGLAISAIFLALLLRSVDLDAVGNAIADAEPGWVLLAGPPFALAIWVRAMRWRLIIRPHLPLTRGDAASLVVIGNAANNVLPVRTGELVRAILAQRHHGASGATTLGSIVVERVLDGLVLAAFLIVTIALAGSSDFLRGLALLAGGGFVVATGLLMALAWRPTATATVLLGLVARLPARLATALAALAERGLEGLTLLRGPRAWSLATGMTAVSWALEAGSYWLVGEAFGLGLNPLLYLGVAGAANLAIAAPSTAGGIGPFEFFTRETVVVFGTSGAAATAQATAYALALHVLVLLPLSLVGLLLLWRRHLGIGALLGAGEALEASGEQAMEAREVTT